MKALALLLLVAALAGCTSSSYDTLDVHDWKQQLDATPQAFLLDVRTPPEFAEMRLANATLVPHTELRGSDALPEDKDKPIFVYCRSGNRSAAASETLIDMGYSDVRNMDGGIIAWTQAGYPVEEA